MVANNKQNTDIKRANGLRYEDPNEVDGYIQEPYHALRISVGLDMFFKEIKGIANKSSHSEITILELASSTGSVAKKIKNTLDCQVIASDIERVPLRKADKTVLDLLQLDVTENLPVKTNSVDGIFMGELIEHIFDPVSMLLECYRTLRGDGFLLITTPNLAALQDRVAFLFGKSPRHVNPLHEYLHLHIRPFTFESLSLVLKKKWFSDNFGGI